MHTWGRSIAFVSFASCSALVGCGGGGGSSASGGGTTGATDSACNECTYVDTGISTEGWTTYTDDTGPPPEDDPCYQVDCGVGACVAGSDGPRCDCPTGYVDVELRCEPCEVLSDGDEGFFDAAGVDVEITLKADSESTDLTGVEVVLQNPATGTGAALQRAGDVFGGKVLRGLYDVVYRAVAPVDERLPRNVAAVLGRIRVSDTEAVEVLLDAARGAFDVTVEDTAVEEGIAEHAELWLRSASDPDDEFFAAAVGDPAAEVVVVRGPYDVYYRAPDDALVGDLLPRNPVALVSDGPVDVYGGELPSTVEVDLDTTRLEGAVLIDGAPAPTASGEWGRIHLVDPTTGARIFIGATNAPAGLDSRAVLAREYDVYYEHVASAMGMVPANGWIKVGSVDVSKPVPPENWVLDIPTTRLEIDVTVDGTAITDPSEGVAEVWVHPYSGGTEGDPGDPVYVGRTDDPPLAVTLVQGTYRVRIRVVEPGTRLPHLVEAEVASVDVAAPDVQQVAVDLPTVSLTGTVTVAMAPAPTDPSESGVLWVEAAAGYAVSEEQSTVTGSIGWRLVPTTYDIYYRNVLGGDVVPVNAKAKVGSVALMPGQDVVYDVDLLPRAVTFMVGYDGAALPTEVTPRITLQDLETGGEFEIVAAGADPSPVVRRLLPGSYLVRYWKEPSVDALAWNEGTAMACIVVE